MRQKYYITVKYVKNICSHNLAFIYFRYFNRWLLTVCYMTYIIILSVTKHLYRVGPIFYIVLLVNILQKHQSQQWTDPTDKSSVHKLLKSILPHRLISLFLTVNTHYSLFWANPTYTIPLLETNTTSPNVSTFCFLSDSLRGIS